MFVRSVIYIAIVVFGLVSAQALAPSARDAAVPILAATGVQRVWAFEPATSVVCDSTERSLLTPLTVNITVDQPTLIMAKISGEPIPSISNVKVVEG